MMGVVGGPITIQSPADAAETSGESDGGIAGGGAKTRRGRLSRLIAPFAAVVLGMAELGVKLLEGADRPLAMIGARIRSLAGWIALATLGAAVVVFILKRF
jgi:hypothetical protein